MTLLISTHPQGSPEWKADRAGKATASRAKDIRATIKSGEAAARRDYRVQLVTERLTGCPADEGYVSKEMLWGTENEPFARMAYEAATGEIVHEAGFAYLSDIAAGCSVDGFIGDEGFFEAKCPKSATHVCYLQEARLPPEHVAQVVHAFWITGRKFCDFVSFDPRLPEKLQLFQVRIHRAEVEKELKAYEAELLQFLREVDALEVQLRKRAA